MGGLCVATALWLTGCGDDGTSTATNGGSTTTNGGSSTTTTAGGGGQTTTSLGGVTSTTRAGSTTVATGKLPDGCGLIDAATVRAAIGNADNSGAPTTTFAPTEIATRCEWRSGIYSISLLVRQGSTVKSDYDNARQGFAAATLTDAQASVRLGARESARNYRLVTYLTYNTTYYVSVTLQGPDRDDAAATEVAASLVRAVLAKLPV
jgi:hypothetical protein